MPFPSGYTPTAEDLRAETYRAQCAALKTYLIAKRIQLYGSPAARTRVWNEWLPQIPDQWKDQGEMCDDEIRREETDKQIP